MANIINFVYGILVITINDNVLDDGDYPVTKLLVAGGMVVAQIISKVGVYEVPDFVGSSMVSLKKWLDHDPTGEHPEVWNTLVEAKPLPEEEVTDLFLCYEEEDHYAEEVAQWGPHLR